MTEFLLAMLVAFAIGPAVPDALRWFVEDVWTPARGAPVNDGAPDFIHSVKTNYADPIDDYRAGYIDRRTFVARTAALKRYITADDLVEQGFR